MLKDTNSDAAISRRDSSPGRSARISSSRTESGSPLPVWPNRAVASLSSSGQGPRVLALGDRRGGLRELHDRAAAPADRGQGEAALDPGLGEVELQRVALQQVHRLVELGKRVGRTVELAERRAHGEADEPGPSTVVAIGARVGPFLGGLGDA